jgi:hypothetical protein
MQPVRLPTDPGAQYFLRWASREIVGRAPGARRKAASLIEACDHTAALPYVRRAIEEAERRKVREDIANPSRPNYARTLLMLAEAYEQATGRLPTRGGQHYPSQFERFLEVALGDLIRSRPQSLGKHWKRAHDKQLAKLQAATDRLVKIIL